MATIKDVARRAGVSHGTVSNVLNGKAGIAPDKIRRVLEAVEALGYVPDQTAKNLKRSASKAIAVILPNITDPHYARLFTGVERVFSEAGYSVSLYITHEIPAKEGSILEEAHRNRVAGVVVVSCEPNKSERFEKLEGAGIRVVCAERERRGRGGSFAEIGSDDSILEATRTLIAEGRRDLVIVAGPQEYSSERACVEAFRLAHKEQGLPCPERFIRISNFDRESAFREAMALFEGSDIPQGVISTSSILMEGILTAYSMTKALFPLRPDFLSLAEDSWTADPDDGVRRLKRPSTKLGESAAELLLEQLGTPGFYQPRRVRLDPLASPKGHGDRETTEGRDGTRRVHAGEDPLRVLMLEGSHARAITALIPDFQEKTGIEVEIQTCPYEDLYTAISAAGRQGSADVLQIDIPWLPEFVRAGLVQDLTDFADEYPEALADFIPGIVDTYARVENRIYALPYLYGTQLLFYRKDLFEDEGVRHAFRARFKTELRAPATWPEFNAVASFFAKATNPESPLSYGTTLGARVSSGAVCEFLPRQWGFGGETFAPDGGIVLDKPENCWALENYAESFAYAQPGAADAWWNEQVDSFVSGEAAMMLLFVAHATEITNRQRSSVVGKIGYAPVPGGTGLLGGWSLAIGAGATSPEKAFQFLSWASGPELAVPTTVLGGTTSSLSLYKSSELLSVYPWLPKALEGFGSSRKRVLPARLLEADFTERDYENILGSAVHDCVIGKLGAEEALHRAKQQLEAATARRGGI